MFWPRTEYLTVSFTAKRNVCDHGVIDVQEKANISTIIPKTFYYQKHNQTQQIQVAVPLPIEYMNLHFCDTVDDISISRLSFKYKGREVFLNESMIQSQWQLTHPRQEDQKIPQHLRFTTQEVPVISTVSIPQLTSRLGYSPQGMKTKNQQLYEASIKLFFTTVVLLFLARLAISPLPKIVFATAIGFIAILPSVVNQTIPLGPLRMTMKTGANGIRGIAQIKEISLMADLLTLLCVFFPFAVFVGYQVFVWYSTRSKK